MTESKLFAYGARENSFFPPKLSSWVICKGKKVFKGRILKVLGANNERGKFSSHAKEKKQKTLNPVLIPAPRAKMGLRERNIPPIHAQKEGPRAGRPERNRRLFWLLKSLQFWECWKQPPGKSQHHPEGCGRNYCQETEVPSTQGAVRRPGQAAARGSWYRLEYAPQKAARTRDGVSLTVLGETMSASKSVTFFTLLFF